MTTASQDTDLSHVTLAAENVDFINNLEHKMSEITETAGFTDCNRVSTSNKTANEKEDRGRKRSLTNTSSIINNDFPDGRDIDLSLKKLTTKKLRNLD